MIIVFTSFNVVLSSDGNRLIENQKDFVMKIVATTFGSLVVSVAALAAVLISEEANHDLS